MRYYRLELKDKNGNPKTPLSLQSSSSSALSGSSSSGTEAGVITSLLSNGTTNPAALNIEIDVAVYQAAAANARSYVRIYGLGIQDIARAYDYNDGFATLKVGMTKGYPLCDESQRGTIISGQIQQAFGNWVGTDMTLDMFFLPGGGTDPGTGSGTVDAPSNFQFTWATGEKLSVLIQRVIKQAMGSRQINISVKGLSAQNDRVAAQDAPGVYTNLKAFAQWIQANSIDKSKKDDQGVIITFDGDNLQVFDTVGQASSGLTQINFQDLLGQVVWYGPNMVTAKLVMRGDLRNGNIIQFPKGLPSTVTQSSYPVYGTSRSADSLGFSGQEKFTIMQMQHWGNFRQPDAMAWNTTIWAYLSSGTAASASSSSVPAATTGGAGP